MRVLLIKGVPSSKIMARTKMTETGKKMQSRRKSPSMNTAKIPEIKPRTKNRINGPQTHRAKAAPISLFV